MKLVFSVILMVILAAIALFWRQDDRREMSWKLPDDTVLRFFHKEPGFFESDHAKCLLHITEKDGLIGSYEFAAGHSGYANVELRIREPLIKAS